MADENSLLEGSIFSLRPRISGIASVPDKSTATSTPESWTWYPPLETKILLQKVAKKLGVYAEEQKKKEIEEEMCDFFVKSMWITHKLQGIQQKKSHSV